MVKFIFYGDDSFDSKNGRVMAVAGYLAREDVWEMFSEDWRWILENAKPKPVDEWKSADAQNRMGEFAGWTKDEAIALTTQVVQCIGSAAYPGIVGVGASIVLDDFYIGGKWEPGLLDTKKRTGYVACFATVIGMLCGRFGKMLSEGTVECVFDKQSGCEGSACEIFRNMTAAHKNADGSPLKAPEFLDSRRRPPLQAADLLAYETFKHTYNERFNPRRVRTALERLVTSRMHLAKAFDSEWFEGWQRAKELGVPYDQAFPDVYDSDVWYRERKRKALEVVERARLPQPDPHDPGATKG